MGSPGPRGPESREVKELRPSSVRHGLAAVQVAIACLVTLRPFLLFKEPLAVASAFVLPISPVKDPHRREVFVERWPVQPKW